MASGIYKITNKINGHIYIGSSIDIKRRWQQHVLYLNNHKHHSSYLQRAWDKYGADAFEFSIIELCFPLALIFREQYYIDTYNPEYSVRKKAGSNLGIKNTPEHNAKISASNMGRVIKPETRAKIAETLKGNKNAIGYKHSVEAKAKMSISQKGKKITPEHKAAISLFHTGKIVSQETRDKLSVAQSGKTYSLESRAKMALSQLARFAKKRKPAEK
jgi:group I intron endonuclease